MHLKCIIFQSKRRKLFYCLLNLFCVQKSWNSSVKVNIEQPAKKRKNRIKNAELFRSFFFYCDYGDLDPLFMIRKEGVYLSKHIIP
jgi:hypothetical protein